MRNNSQLSSLRSQLIIIIEDDKLPDRVDSRALANDGFAVRTASSLAQARALISKRDPDVILLDTKMPDGSGIDFCGEIRETTRAHIIFLASAARYAEELSGLRAGGNDYLRKPYNAELLRERIKNAVARRYKPDFCQSEPILQKGAFTLDAVTTRARCGDTDLLLTPKEFSMLYLLMQNEGKTAAAERIYEKLWGQAMAGDKNAIQTVASRLRKKIEPYGYTIFTYRGKGYAFEKL